VAGATYGRLGFPGGGIAMERFDAAQVEQVAGGVRNGTGEQQSRHQ